MRAKTNSINHAIKIMKNQFRIGVIVFAVAASIAPYQQTFSAELEEILVTATRRSESMQDVSVSITALSSRKIERARIEGVRDLAIMTPGLSMTQRSVTWVPYIRGIGTGDTAGGHEAGVATYVDGVYLASPYGASLSFNNIDRVEILKGPQGTLFGRNATGGLIHIITKDPTHETTAYGKIGYGNYQTLRGQFYASTGLSDNLAADIALNYLDQGDAFGKNVVPNGPELKGNADFDIRSKWLYENDKNRFTFIADYGKHESGQGDNRALQCGSVAVGFGCLPDWQNVQHNWESYAEVENWGLSGKFEHQFNAFDFQSITAYRETILYSSFDNDGIPISIISALQNVEVSTFTQELQITSNGDGRFQWIAGAFYMNDDNGYVEPHGLELSGLPFVLPGNIPFLDRRIHRIETESISAYAEGTYDISDKARLTAGIRVTRDEKEIVGEEKFVSTDGSTVFLTIPAAKTSGNPKTWTEPTWRIAFEYDLAEDIMLYASYNRGFRSGDYNTVTVTGNPVEPEIADAYELGFKSYLLDGRVRLNGALFFTDYQDLQVVISRGPTTDLLNAGSAEIFGFELEGEATLSDEVSIHFGYNYLDTEYTEFEPVACHDRSPTGETIPYQCDVTGNQLLRAPENAFNLGILYEKPISSGLIGASLDYFWTDDFVWELDARLVESSYGLLNGQLYWESIDERYGITLWARNLLDEEYSSFQVAQPGLGDQYSPAPPRTYGVEFKFNFK